MQQTQRTSIDSKKLKSAYPEVWEVVKKTTSSSSLKYEEIATEAKG